MPFSRVCYALFYLYRYTKQLPIILNILIKANDNLMNVVKKKKD